MTRPLPASTAVRARAALPLLLITSLTAGCGGDDPGPEPGVNGLTGLTGLTGAAVDAGLTGTPAGDGAAASTSGDGAVAWEGGLTGGDVGSQDGGGADGGLDAGEADDAGDGAADASSDADPGTDVDSGDADTGEGGPDAGDDDAGDDDAGDGPGLGDELCELEPSQVLVLGDSYVALDPSFVLLDQHPFTSNLEALARDAGALGEGEEYRDHALSGASMAYLPSIPAQLEDAIAADDDIDLVIMTGGGNDILVNNRLCLEYETEEELMEDQACLDVVQNAIDEGQAMFDRGVEVGARAVIYFFYPRLPGGEGGGIAAGTYPNTILDYAYPKVRALCERQTEAPCFFVDMRTPFDADGDGQSDEGLINIDGIHPTYAGSEILAEEVWKVMQRECLASE